MKNSVQNILNKTPPYISTGVDKYSDFVIRVNKLIQNIDLKSIKEDTAIHDWITGKFDGSIFSICKLESELNEELIQIV